MAKTKTVSGLISEILKAQATINRACADLLSLQEPLPKVAALTLVRKGYNMYAIAIASVPHDQTAIDHLALTLKVGDADAVTTNYSPDTLVSGTFSAEPGDAIHVEAIYVGVDPTKKSPLITFLDEVIPVTPPSGEVPNVAALSLVFVPDSVPVDDSGT